MQSVVRYDASAAMVARLRRRATSSATSANRQALIGRAIGRTFSDA